MGFAANKKLVAFVLLFLVPSASSVFYDALANDACTPGADTDLPDTPLLRGYPRHDACLLLQGCCATVLSDPISLPLTTALDYMARAVPYAGLIVEGWRTHGSSPPSALCKHWLYCASMSAQLILYVIWPRPSPLLESLFGVTSTAAVAVLAAWHVPHARELGASPVAHAMLHAALAAALAVHAAWSARGGAGTGGAQRPPQGQTQRQPKQLAGDTCHRPTVDTEQKALGTVGSNGAPACCLDSTVGDESFRKGQPGRAAAAGESLRPDRAGGHAGSQNGCGVGSKAHSFAAQTEATEAHGSHALQATAAGQPAAPATQQQLLPCTPQCQLDASLRAIKRCQALATGGSRLDGAARPAYMSPWRHCSLAIKVPCYTPGDVPPRAGQRVARAVRELGRSGGGSGIEVLSVAMREGCIQLVLELVKRRPGLDGRASSGAEAQPPGTRSGKVGELESGVQVDQALVEAVLRALQLPDAPCDRGSRARELEGSGQQGVHRAGAASGGAAGQAPGGVTWRVVRDNGCSPPSAKGQQNPPAPSSSPSFARLVLEPRLLLLAPPQQQQQALSGQDQGADHDQSAWGLFRVVYGAEDAVAAAGDVPVDQQRAAPPKVWVRHGGRFLPVRVRQLQEADQGAGGEEAGGGTGGAGGGGATTGVTVLEVQLLGQPPAAGGAMVDIVWPCGLWRCVPLLLTRQESLAAELVPELDLPYDDSSVRQDDDVAWWQDTDDFMMDLGMWEEALDRLQGDAEGRCGSGRCPLYPTELRVLGQDLLAYAEECGWGRTAAWVRQGLEQLQAWEGGEGQQCVGVGQGGERAAASPLDGGLRRRLGVKSREEGGNHEGGEAGASARAGDVGWPRTASKHTASKPQGSSHGAEPEYDGGSSPLEQAFHVSETLLLLLLVATRGLARPVLLMAQYLSMGPGALITLSRLMLPHATWSRVIAGYRQPRYYLHFAGNLLLLLPQVPSFSPVFLRGPSVAVYEGMLLPLCCTLPTRRALWAMIANGAAFAMLIVKLEVAAGNINPMHALMRAALAGVSLLALGMLCTVWRNSSSRAAARVQGRAGAAATGGAAAQRGRPAEPHGSRG